MPYDNQNIFAKIIRGEIACKKILEDEHFIAFHDAAPAAPVHALVVPKGEYCSFHDFIANAGQAETQAFFAGVRKVAEALELEESGYRLIANHGANALQSVPHFHMHLLGGGKLAGWESVGAAAAQ